MKNFYTGLMTYFNAAPGSVHNSFWTAIGGRMFNTVAPEDTTLPYCVFTHVAGVQSDTFTEDMDEVTLQFSIFSEGSSSGEVHDAMTACKALFDGCSFQVTSGVVVQFMRGVDGLIIEDYETESGSQRIWHYHVDYRVIVRKA